MGKQLNKVEKRRRRRDYLQRKKTQPKPRSASNRISPQRHKEHEDKLGFPVLSAS